MRSFLGFFATSVALVAVIGWVLSFAFRAPAERHAIVVSAGVALVAQLFAFAIVRLTSRTNVVAGWGLGMLLRLVVLVVFGFVFVRALALPPEAAMISLALFFFGSTLVEPLWLRS